MTFLPVAGFPRVPLRLRLSPRVGRGRLDGAWWPQGADLDVELADLVDHFPRGSGRIVGAAWPNCDARLVTLQTSSRTVLRLFVVPCETDREPAEAALLAAAAQGCAEGAEHLLASAAQKASGQVRSAYVLKRPARRLRSGLSSVAPLDPADPVR